MAGELPKPVDKGKGKAVDGEPSKPEEVKKDKDGKPIVNGKAEDGAVGGELPPASNWTGFLLISHLAAEELSEEDQQLKSELDMLVERLTV
jgi:26S proteasome regulatory subunit N1